MNEYTFKMTLEMSKTIEGKTLEAARDALVWDEADWELVRVIDDPWGGDDNES